MRKFTILMALVAFASSAMAQLNLMDKPSTLSSKEMGLEKANFLGTKTAVWSVDFEETTPTWTTTQTADMPVWTISDQAGAPSYWETTGGFYIDYLGKFSLTGNEVSGHWAWLDVAGPLLPGGPGGVQAEEGTASIQFDNIDLTGVMNPKLMWYQMHRAFNPSLFDTYVDVSIDGGTTWTSLLVNEETEQGEYDVIEKDLFIGSIAADEANVSIRFRWETIDASEFPVGYGWQLDDISIVENPSYDVTLVDGRMNFFTIEDYTVPGNEDYFHISSHYGQVPVQQYDSPSALSWFNVIVENKGVTEVTPTVIVRVTDPYSNLILEEELDGNSLAIGERDTIDLIEDFIITSPVIGQYLIEYEVYIDGSTDENDVDNVFESTFYITHDKFAKDVDDVSGRLGLSGYSIGGVDSEMLATDYIFLFEEEVLSMDVFINDQTDVGTSFIARLLVYNSETELYDEKAATSLNDIEESDLGTWYNVTFEDIALIDIPDGEPGITVRAAVEIYYNTFENFYIGSDNSVSYGPWCTYIYVPADEKWYYGFVEAAPAIRLNVPYVTNVDANNNDLINIYPNPASTSLNIENVEGANVQIINMMGQVVENIESANMVNTVDMSKYANGTYFVKVINGSETSTHKVNLMK